MRPMTLKYFDSLCRRDFENGAVIEEIRDTIKQRDELLAVLRKIEREATAIAATCPPAPHACPACEILFVTREAIAKAESEGNK